jgi:predicted 3-demethylubiquinone-9 3-methyltransferase (glyoxalase superfamily)
VLAFYDCILQALFKHANMTLQTICLRYNYNVTEVANYYQRIFKEAVINQQQEISCSITIHGTSLLLLNTGNAFKQSSAGSNFMYCGSEEYIDALYAEITKEGKIQMPLAAYPWSRKYAWVVDKYGVHWQLDVDDIKTIQKITPAFLFVNNKKALVKKATEKYLQFFKNNMLLMEMPTSATDTEILFAQLKLEGFIVNLMSGAGKHDFDFTNAYSLVVNCDTQAEIDYYWTSLGENGTYERCGWLKDEFGISWQIVPNVLPKLLSNPNKAGKVIEAMLKMEKFEIEVLEAI